VVASIAAFNSFAKSFTELAEEVLLFIVTIELVLVVVDYFEMTKSSFSRLLENHFPLSKIYNYIL
jgi:uncharacterized membrane protein (DUF373 family)